MQPPEATTKEPPAAAAPSPRVSTPKEDPPPGPLPATFSVPLPTSSGSRDAKKHKKEKKQKKAKDKDKKRKHKHGDKAGAESAEGATDLTSEQQASGQAKQGRRASATHTDASGGQLRKGGSSSLFSNAIRDLGGESSRLSGRRHES